MSERESPASALQRLAAELLGEVGGAPGRLVADQPQHGARPGSRARGPVEAVQPGPQLGELLGGEVARGAARGGGMAC